MSYRRGWLVAYYGLFAITLFTGALNMLGVKGGFLTNHLADLAVPAWLYIASRGLHAARARSTWLHRTVGRSPETAAIMLFVASAATEVSQRYWPRGIFSGRFDALDLFAYAVGLTACYLVDRLSAGQAVVESPAGGRRG